MNNVRDIAHEQIAGSTDQQLHDRRLDLIKRAPVVLGVKLYTAELRRIDSELYCRANGIISKPWVTWLPRKGADA